jgi:hypothetical protein
MALSTQPHGKLLDFEQYIDHQLGRTRARIKLTDVVTASLILIAAAVGLLFLEVVLDHLIGLPVWLRRIVLLLGLSGGGAFAVWRIVLPMVRRVNGFYAARTIEETDPSFKNSLINYLDLRRRRGELSKAALAAIEAKAVRDLTQVEIDSVVNQHRLMQVAYIFSAVVVIFCLYAAMTPKSILDSAKRALLADVVRPTNTRLVNIKPGDDPEAARVVAGTHVPFTVEVQGTRPERVVLHWSADGGKFFAAQELAPGRNYYDPWQFTMRNVQQSVVYSFTGGDAESLRYHLEVLPAPMVTAVALDYEFPTYTGVPPRANVEGGNVEAIEGTKVTIHARTNEPARSAFLEFSKAQVKQAPMEVSTANPRELVGRFNVKEPGSYTIKFTTTGGQPNPDPVVYDIVVHRDNPPSAHFVKPDRVEVKVPSNVEVPLVMAASDDFGVKDATLHVFQESESLVSENLLEQRAPTREFKQTEMLDLARLRVKPGSKLTYWLTVRDTKEPVSNRAETLHQTIVVEAPLPPAEKKKFDEARRKDLDEEQAPPAEPTELTENTGPMPPPQPGKAATEQDQNQARNDGQPRKEPKEIERSTADRGEKDQENGNPPAPEPKLSPEEMRRIKDLMAMNRQPPQAPPPAGSASNNAPNPSNTPNAGNATQTNPAQPSNPNLAPSEPATRVRRANPSGNNAPSGPGTNAPAPANGPTTADSSPQVQRAGRNNNQTPSASPRNPPGNNAPGTKPSANTTPNAGNHLPGQPNPNTPTPGQPGPNNPPSAPTAPNATPNTTTPGQPNPNAPKPGESSSNNSAAANIPSAAQPNQAGENTPQSQKPGPNKPAASPTAAKPNTTKPAQPGSPASATNSRQDQSPGTKLESSAAKPGQETPSAAQPRSETAPKPGEPGASSKSGSENTSAVKSGEATSPTAPLNQGEAQATKPAQDNPVASESPSSPTAKPAKAVASTAKPGQPGQAGARPGASETSTAKPGQSGQENATAGQPNQEAMKPGQEGNTAGKPSLDSTKPGQAGPDHAKPGPPNAAKPDQAGRESAKPGAPDRNATTAKPGPDKLQARAPETGTPRPGSAAKPDETPSGRTGSSSPTASKPSQDQTSTGEPGRNNNPTTPDSAKSDQDNAAAAKSDQGRASATQDQTRSQPGQPGASTPKPGQPEQNPSQANPSDTNNPMNGQPGQENPQTGPSGANTAKPSQSSPTPGQTDANAPKPGQTPGTADQNRPKPGTRTPGTPPGQPDAHNNPTPGQSNPPTGPNRQANPPQPMNPGTANPMRPGPGQANPQPPQAGQPNQNPNTPSPNQPNAARPDQDNSVPGQPNPMNPNANPDTNPNVPPSERTGEKSPTGPKTEAPNTKDQTNRPKEQAKAGQNPKDRQPDKPKAPSSNEPRRPGEAPQPDQATMPNAEQPGQPSSPKDQQTTTHAAEGSTSATDQAAEKTDAGQPKPSPETKRNRTQPPDARKSIAEKLRAALKKNQKPDEEKLKYRLAEEETKEQAQAKPAPKREQPKTETPPPQQEPVPPQPDSQGDTPGQSGSHAGKPGNTPGQGHTPRAGQGDHPGTTTSGQPSQGRAPAGSQEQGKSQATHPGQGHPGGPTNGASNQTGADNPNERPSVQNFGQAGKQGEPSNAGSQGEPSNAPQGTTSPSAGTSNGPGSPNGQPSGGSPRGGGQTANGGGPGVGEPGSPITKDETSKPSPRAESKPQNAAETVAPNQPQSELVLRKLQDLLKNDQAAAKLEKETGMSREEMEQFVRKFSKAPKPTPGEGRKIEVKPGESKPSGANTSLPGLNPGTHLSTQSLRDRGAVVQDQVRDNIEGTRFTAPPEVRSGYEAYKSTLSRSKTVNPVRVGSGSGGR